MNEAVGKMLEKYVCLTEEDRVHALREILRKLPFLGYGGVNFLNMRLSMVVQLCVSFTGLIVFLKILIFRCSRQKPALILPGIFLRCKMK